MGTLSREMSKEVNFHTKLICLRWWYVMLQTVNLVLTKRNSDMDPLGAVELAIGGGGRRGDCEFTFLRETEN